MRCNRLAVVLIFLGMTFQTIHSAVPSVAANPRFECRLNGNAVFPNIVGRVRFVRASASSVIAVRARNLRPLHGKPISLHVNGISLGREEHVTQDGRLLFRVAGSGLVDYVHIRAGSRAILRGPKGHLVDGCRLRRSGSRK